MVKVCFTTGRWSEREVVYVNLAANVNLPVKIVKSENQVVLARVS